MTGYSNPAVFRGTNKKDFEKAMEMWAGAGISTSTAPTVYGNKTIYTVRAEVLGPGLPPGEYGLITPAQV